MHLLPILVFFSIVVASLLCAFGGPARLLRFIRDCVSVSEDHWTWTTRSGEWFEEVEIEMVDENSLVLKHRHGVVHLAIEALSEKSRHVLYHTEKWAEHLAESADETIAELSGRRTQAA
jgi:hypothetical protein